MTDRYDLEGLAASLHRSVDELAALAKAGSETEVDNAFRESVVDAYEVCENMLLDLKGIALSEEGFDTKTRERRL